MPKVYDDEKEKTEKPGSHDDLGVNPADRKAEIASLEESFAAPSANEPDTKSTEELKDTEENADDLIGEGYREERKRIRGRILTRRRAIGGGAIAGVVGIIIAIFVALLPLKLNTIVENLQNRFFASAESAVQIRSEKLFERYVRNHILPVMGKKNCNSTRVMNRNCIANIVGETPAQRLFRGWKDARLENKLFNDYGIEISKGNFTGPNGSYQYRLSVKDGGSIDIDGFQKGKTGLFEAVGTRGEIRQQLKDAFEGETRLKRVFYRYKVGRLLERKYGIKRCLVACKNRDYLADWKDSKKLAFKAYVVDRVVMPHNDTLGVLLECLFQGGCDTYVDKGTDYDRRDRLQQRTAKILASYADKYGEEAVVKLISAANVIAERGLTAYVVEKVVQKVASQSVAQAAGKGVPVVGQINAVAQIIGQVRNATTGFKRWFFVVNSTAMVSLYMMYRTNADEIKSGNVDSELVGSMVSALGDQVGNDKHTNQPAEASPLYNNLLGDGGNSQTAFNWLSPRALAADTATATTKYTCDDNQSVPAGKLICPEESLVTNGVIAKIGEAFKSNPVLLGLTGVADFWNRTAGAVINAVSSLVGGALHSALKIIPGYSSAEKVITSVGQKLFQLVAEWLIPSPISDNMSGARTFNMLAGGADVAGNQYAQYGLGGRQLSSVEVSQLRNQKQQELRDQFSRKSFIARMFDKNDTNSLVSQVALATPTSSVRFAQSTASSLLSNPVLSIFSGFSSMLGGGKTYAAIAQEDPFGVPQSGYSPNPDDPALNVDPDLLTEKYCAVVNKDWADGTGQFAGTLKIDPDTGTDIHTKENPCLLEQAAAASAGGYFTTDVLSPQDLGTSAAASNTSTTAAEQIVGDPYQSSVDVACAPKTKDLGVHDAYSKGVLIKMRLCGLPNLANHNEESTPGSSYYISGADGIAIVNSRVSGAWYSLVETAKTAGVALSSNSSFRTNAHQEQLWINNGMNRARVAPPGYSSHQAGVAIDFSGMGPYSATTGATCSSRQRRPGNKAWEWLYNNAYKYGFRQYAAEAWHWDALPVANRCGFP